MARNNDSYYRQLDMISGMSKPPDYTDQIQKRLADFRAQQGNIGGLGSLGNQQGGGDSFARFVAAITGQESGGNYSARNRSSGALGRYQIMPGNIASWSREAIGRVVTPQQFLSNPKIQDAIAQYKLRQYVNRYGYEGAAAAWYGGPGVARSWSSRTNPQGAYPSIASYVNQIMRRMGR